MAENSSSGSSGKSSSSSSRSKKSSGSRNGQRKDPTEIARAAAQTLMQLTGRQPESVLGLRQDDDGWKVTLEVVELSRIPNSTDLLGCYVVSVDEKGEVLGFERSRRYQRGQTGGDER